MLSRLTRWQSQRPWLFLVSGFALCAVATVGALQLRLQTGFESLLPESRASVQELKRVSKLTSGISTVYVVLEAGPGTPVSALRAAGDALVPELNALGAPWVGHAEDGVQASMAFLLPRAGLFLEQDRLQKIADDVEQKYARAVGSATGLFVDLEDDGAASADGGVAQIDFSELRQSLKGEGLDPDRYPDGYYQSHDGKALVVLVRSKVANGDFDTGIEALERIRGVVAKVDVTRFDPNIKVGYAGDLTTGVSEFKAINADLTEVGISGVVLIGAVVLLYYMRARMLGLLLLTMGVGVSWTFGVTQLTVGRLNIATGFLFSIIAGNGINFAIIYMARYLEERRAHAVEPSMLVAAQQTWKPTLTAGLAAGASYGSLAATDFRGFHDFGLIGGVGILLCWLATFWVLPPMLAVTERIWPMEKTVSATLAKLRLRVDGGHFGAPFVFLVSRWPRAVAVGGALVTALALFGAVHWVRSDPMEYDLLNLRTDASSRAEEIRIDHLGDAITGQVSSGGMAILVDSPDDVAPLEAELWKRKAAAPDDLKPFSGLFALQDFVPKDQAAKIPLLQKLKRRLLRAHEQGAIAEADWKQVSSLLPPDDLQPFTMAELPEPLARAFTEADGTRGRIVYISPTSNPLVDDAHYLFRWADSYRETTLPSGKKVIGSGRAVIYADMWAQVIEDAPKAVWLSLGATVLVVFLAFRGGRSTVAVLASLLVGVVWMLGLLVVLGVKLNFLNFVALPITFGIGVDYSVNVVQRYLHEGRGSALLAIRETGGAVILCSLTTILGYLALVRSQNFAVRSLGMAAFLGEICCLLVSVLVLPAVLMVLDRKLPQKP